MRQRYLKVLAKQLKYKLKPKLVLDIGCAKGLLVQAFRRIGVLCYGIDIHPSGDGTIKADARSLPFKDCVIVFPIISPFRPINNNVLRK